MANTPDTMRIAITIIHQVILFPNSILDYIEFYREWY